ncbi:hypothetical protein FEM33_14900 [Dyadobacter flavalbus]|uniref:Uncharacterized protein n=1 Tax=Dyadobacter flavalbus TaxID=2579942 RepID=A0A5M8QWZ2_9BACT|nr:bestrophin family ion channel [Dyadobacter flavalbus]KAA6438923.1 hypothetical protein FEM33_14900 [Dyadobacter flavalbus]
MLPEYITRNSVGIATTLGIAISILLSYKINQAYSRWWEARTIWGAIVNDSRSLVLQLQLYLNEQIKLIYKISHYQIAWCYSLEKSLRRQDISEVLNSILTIDDIEKVRKHSNTPLAINQLQTLLIKELFKKGFLNEFARIKIEETLTRLVASMGKCERIKNTVFPPTFGQILNVAIYLFTIFLSLSSTFQLNIILQIAILTSISVMFFFLEELAHSLQDPFHNYPTDIPITAISRELDKLVASVNPADPTPLELHRSPMFGGKKIWRQYDKGQRCHIIKEALGVLARSHQSNRIFACVVNKAKLSPTDPVEFAFEQLDSRSKKMRKRRYFFEQLREDFAEFLQNPPLNIMVLS